MEAGIKKRSRALNRMSAREVETKAEPGLYPDGGGLYLRVSSNGHKKWELRYKSPLTGSRVDMGLGRANKGHVSLAAARAAAQSARDLISRKLDPIVERERERAERIAEAAKPAAKTFGQFAEEWLKVNEGGFRNAKHRAQWHSTLRQYAGPLLEMSLAGITTQDVLNVLKPIWSAKPETAKRTQGRIERLLNAARAAELRFGENPARWRGHLDELLPKRPKAVHHPALRHSLAPQFAHVLRKQAGVAARALEFLILTAARSGEVRGMTWAELDAEWQVWTIPGDRMKAGVAHRVPLGNRAREILAEMQVLRRDDAGERSFVFPGAKAQTRLSDMTLGAVLKRMAKGDEGQAKLLLDGNGSGVVVHGFRSTFRDWAEDVARFPARVIEAALAHTLKDKAEAAYRRGDAFEPRKELIEVWETYLASAAPSGKPPAPAKKSVRR